MTSSPRVVRSPGRWVAALVGVLCGAAVVVGTDPAGAAGGVVTGDVAAAAYGEQVVVQGHGWGHGRGLGQWGALGYATEAGWSTDQILGHYYGGTTAGTLDDANELSVRLTRFDDAPTVVTSDTGGLVADGIPGTFRALLVQPLEDGSYGVSSGEDCDGPWEPVALPAPPAQVRMSVTAPDGDSANPAELVSVCEPDGTRRWYRGWVAAVRDAEGRARTVNGVRVGAYLRGVVPREMPASWADLGGGKGAAALRAQAVAARSYALAEDRYSFARTCDTASCQVYGGAFSQQPGGDVTALEDPRSDEAVKATAGAVRMIGTAVARTEFSSSTGGWTAGGTFPSVADDGDDIAGNKNHTWTATIDVDTIEEAYPAIGSLVVLDVPKRNGIGDFGGRAVSVVIQGTKGKVTLTGNEFRSKFGLKSDWYRFAPSFVDVPAAAVGASSGQGYWIAAQDGSVYNFGGAPYQGSMIGTRLNGGIVSMSGTADGQGYWLVGTDGGVFAFNAPFYGSTGSMKLNKPVVAMTPRPQGDGYWFVASDGGIFAFGNAGFAGSMGGTKLFKPVVGMAATASGNGYWLVASDGGMFAFGDAGFFGSTGGRNLSSPIVGMAARPQGDGYWFVAADGTVYAFGAAGALGSATGLAKGAKVVGMTATPSGNGYRLVATDGSTFAFGDAT